MLGIERSRKVLSICGHVKIVEVALLLKDPEKAYKKVVIPLN